MYIAILLLFLTTSCGWHVANSERHNSTISVPYAYGDGDGLLTSEIIAQVQKETGFDYVQGSGEYTLKVTLLDSKSENIGFRYDPHKLKSGKKKLIPDEVRKRLLAKVSLIHTASGKEVLGPAYIMGTCEFDHRYYNLSHNINRFSLGQLTDIDTSYDVVDVPLHRDLAQQIAQWLENSYDKTL
ncbi:MAG: hypothetical protein JSR37_00715 [Verrucomicrobia bacterium]|nr:hypothetical protein [Verrucomicrobiota bacterium]MBS0637351.1 hypothetical protein [Verrucomicrobiota bacterium]